MKALFFTSLFAAVFAAATLNAQDAPAPAPEKTEAPTARSKALELAGAFANDGYRLRDGFYAGALESGKPILLQVNLFSGNEYWFSAAAVPPARKIAVTVFDAAGKPVDIQTYEDGPAAAAGFVPDVSGEYYVQVSLVEGDKSDFCVLYSYK
jgi:hypothetical protein